MSSIPQTQTDHTVILMLLSVPPGAAHPTCPALFHDEPRRSSRAKRSDPHPVATRSVAVVGPAVDGSDGLLGPFGAPLFFSSTVGDLQRTELGMGGLLDSSGG